jgi:hypothetical protein
MTIRIAHSLALIFLLAAVAAAQDERPRSFLDGAVTFTLPADWPVARHLSTAANGYVMMTIPYPLAEKARLRTQATLSANRVPEKVTVRTQSDGVYKNKYEGLAVLSDTFDGDDWRTIAWVMRTGGTPYLTLDRFGVVNRKSVELMVSFPVVEGGNPEWLAKAVADFNTACESLKIDGRNRFEGRVSLDKISAQLKVKRP